MPATITPRRFKEKRKDDWGRGGGVFTLWRTRGIFFGEQQPQLEHAILPGSTLFARNARLPLHQIKRPVRSFDRFRIEALAVRAAKGAVGRYAGTKNRRGSGDSEELRKDGLCARVCALRRGGCGRATSSKLESAGRAVCCLAVEGDFARR